jgi:hypothetical protein
MSLGTRSNPLARQEVVDGDSEPRCQEQQQLEALSNVEFEYWETSRNGTQRSRQKGSKRNAWVGWGGFRFVDGRSVGCFFSGVGKGSPRGYGRTAKRWIKVMITEGERIRKKRKQEGERRRGRLKEKERVER